MRTHHQFGKALLLLLAVAIALPAFAAEGRRPIWEPVVIGPGAPSGAYVLTRDVRVPAGGGPAIAIVAGGAVDNVDVDLNGFTLFGDPAGGTPVIEVVGPIRKVTIRNGEVRAGGPGADAISFLRTERAVVEDVSISDALNGIRYEEGVALVARRNVIVNSSDAGIRVIGGGGPAVTGEIEHNVIQRATTHGIIIEGPHSAFAVNHNRVEETAAGNGMTFIGGEGFLVAMNTIETSGDNGIFAEACNNSKIYNNVLTANGANGMTLVALGGFLVLDNSSSFNAGSGIFIDGFINKVERNALHANGGFGLHFGPGSDSNTYGRNSSRFNGAAGPACGGFVPPTEPCGGIGGGGGSLPPDFCNEGPDNTSFCDNLMPGPPLS